MTAQNNYYLQRTQEELLSIFSGYGKKRAFPIPYLEYLGYHISLLSLQAIHRILLALKPSKILTLVRLSRIFIKHKSTTVGISVLLRDRYKAITTPLIAAEMFWRSGGDIVYFFLVA